jgi:hypothetical protein
MVTVSAGVFVDGHGLTPKDWQLSIGQGAASMICLNGGGGCGSIEVTGSWSSLIDLGVVKMNIEHLQTRQGRLGFDGATGPGFDRPTIPRCAALWLFWPYSGCRIPVVGFDNFGLRWIFKVLW